MNYTEHKITLDVNETVSQVSLSVKKGDTGRRLLILLAEKGYPYHISEDCYAVFTAKKPDGHVVFNACSIRDCVIIYDITAQTVAAAGFVDCEIILYGANGKQITSASFSIIVEDTIYDTETEIESTSEYNALSELIAKVQSVYAQGLMAAAIMSKAGGEVINLSDASDNSLQGLTVYGKTVQDGTPTPEVPVEMVNVGAEGSIEAKVMGRNIISDMVYSSFSTDYASLVICNDTGAVKKGELYTISVTLTADTETKAYWNSISKLFAHEVITVLAGTNRYSKTFTALEDGIIGAERILVSKSATGDGVTIKPSDCQIECGKAATAYDLSAEQSVVIATPSGLPGIAVDSGGNYTDSDGQQWICDEIDLGRGVRVQRIGKLDLSTISTWVRGTGNGWANLSAFHSANALPKAVPVDGYDTKAKIMCNRLIIEAPGRVAGKIVNSIGQGMGASVYVSVEGIETAEGLVEYLTENETIVQYALAEPVETVLTAEMLDAFAALHTNKPNTTIYNDAGAYMAAEYVVDTKIYIDNKNAASGIVSEVKLLASAWVDEGTRYSQVVEIDGVTEFSQVDLKPSIEQLDIFHDKDLAFVTENEDGVVTVYALGDKPTNDYTIQVTIMEVME